MAGGGEPLSDGMFPLPIVSSLAPTKHDLVADFPNAVNVLKTRAFQEIELDR